MPGRERIVVFFFANDDGSLARNVEAFHSEYGLDALRGPILTGLWVGFSKACF